MHKKSSGEGTDKKPRLEFLIAIKQKMRLRLKVVLISTGALSLLTVAGIILYFQFTRVEPSYAATQTILAEFNFENNLNAKAGAIGSPTLTYDKTLSYVSGGVSGKAFEFSHNESGGVFELTMSTLNYSNITVQWNGQATNPGHTSATIALTGNSGSGYGSTLYTYTFSSTSWTGSAVASLGTAFSNNSQIKIKITYTTDGKNDDIDNLIISGTNSLPIELLNFQGKANSDHVDLTWATVSEINNNYFTIERSVNGKSFEEVLKIPGAGTSKTIQMYAATDDAPIEGINYYRLMQTDYDGRFAYFPIQIVEFAFTAKAKNLIIKTIGPNPFKDNFNINYSIAKDGEVEIHLTNSLGQLVFKKTLNAVKGFNTYSFNDNRKLPPGVYIVNMMSAGEVTRKKIIKN